MGNRRAGIILLCYIALSGFIQGSPDEELKRLKEKYPDESSVILTMSRQLEIKWVHDSLKIFEKDFEQRICLKGISNMSSEGEISYTPLNKLIDYSAETLVPSGNSYKAKKVTNFIVTDQLEGEGFHNDIKNLHYTYPGLTEGAITQLKLSREITDPYFIGGFYFNNYVPTEHAEFSVTFPEDVDMGYLKFHTDSMDLKFTETRKGKNITWKWTAADLKKIDYAGDMPAFRNYCGHVFLFMKKFNRSGKPVPVLGTLDDLHNWYHTLIHNLNAAPNDSLQHLVDSLVTGATSDKEKVRRIYYWVEDHIKYIAVEIGLGGFIPRTANQVFSYRYGDCKDMASIIVKMLEMAKVNADFTWVGTRDLPYDYHDVPLPEVDNHMIATWSDGDELYFLDATGQYQPLGIPPSVIQGKEAMVDKGPENYLIVRIPVMTAEENTISDSVNLHLNNNVLEGDGIAQFTGYEKVNMFYMLADRTDKDRKNILVTKLLKGSNKFQIENFNIINLGDRDQDLKVAYTFNLQDYGKIAGDEIYINLILEKTFSTDRIASTRKVDLEKEFNQLSTRKYIFSIPDGYKTEYIPSDFAWESKNFGCKIQYARTAKEIIVTHTVYARFLILKVDQFMEWNSMVDALRKAYSSNVILKKSNL